jgi:PTS system nitrogen regulatory IIA component
LQAALFSLRSERQIADLGFSIIFNLKFAICDPEGNARALRDSPLRYLLINSLRISNTFNQERKGPRVKITDFLNAQSVIPALEGRDKNAALEEMADGLAACHPNLDQKKIRHVLVAREKISTTAIGEGVAIPHGKLAGIDRIFGVFGRSPQGVDFASLDGQPTHLFFALIAPENAAADHLKALARISRLLKDDAFRRRLMAAENQQELYAMIAEEDDKF